MAEEEEVSIKFDVDDAEATPKISKMERAVEKLDKSMGKLSSRFERFTDIAGGLVGVFGAAESLRAAKEYIDHVDQIANLTGIAGDHVAGISEALQISGVDAASVESIMTKMVKKSALLTEENKAQAKLAERYGVNLTEGPQKSLIKISKLMTEGKINAGQVGRILGVQGRALADLIDSLNKGPQALGQMFDDAIDKNHFLGGEALDVMQDYDESVNRVGLAWKRLVAGIIVRVAPAMTKLASKFEDSIEGWSEKAGKFASYMVDHMGQLIKLAKTYAKIMLVNTVLEKTTGKGIVGNVGRIAMSEGGVKGVLTGAFSFFAKLTKGTVALRPLLAILGRFTLIGGILAIAYFTIKHIMTATTGAAVRIRQIFTNIVEHVRGIGRQFERMFSEDTGLGRFARWVSEGFLVVIEKISGMLEHVVYGLRILVTMLANRVGFGKAKDIVIGETYSDSGLERLVKEGWTPSLRGDVPTGPASAITRRMRDKFAEFDRARAQYEAAGGPKLWSDSQLDALRKRYAQPTAGGATPQANVYQDFRGSRFDIKQEFAEGFDPDRIAVGFANDIATIGERKLQSGFAPLFSIR